MDDDAVAHTGTCCMRAASFCIAQESNRITYFLINVAQVFDYGSSCFFFFALQHHFGDSSVPVLVWQTGTGTH